MDDIAIEVKNISKAYKLYPKPSLRVKELFSISKKKYYTEYKALDHVSFQLKKGDRKSVV